MVTRRIDVLRLDVHIHGEFGGIEDRLTQLLALAVKNDRRGELMAGELDRIESEVTEISSAVDSAVSLLSQLAQLIRDNVGSPARLNKIADDLDTKGKALAEAVVANTPAEEPPPA